MIIDENKIEGLVEHSHEEYQLDASTDNVIFPDISYTHYDKDDTRSYFRLLRIDDDANCKDAVNLTNEEDHYLEFTVHLDGSNDPADQTRK